jgi:hypothetical protein
MWSLLKSLVGAVVLGILAYAFFFVDLGGQSLSGHFADIWRTPVVQGKVNKLTDGVKRNLEDRLAEAGERAGRQLAREVTNGDHDQLSDEDRRSLDEIIEKADPNRP